MRRDIQAEDSRVVIVRRGYEWAVYGFTTVDGQGDKGSSFCLYDVGSARSAWKRAMGLLRKLRKQGTPGMPYATVNNHWNWEAIA